MIITSMGLVSWSFTMVILKILASFALSLVLLTRLEAQTPNRPLQLLAFGDSITQGFGATGILCSSPTMPNPPPGGYPPILDTLLRQNNMSVDILTSGVCGERTAEALTRLDTLLNSLEGEGKALDAAIFMEGTNDLASRLVSVETIKTNMQLMAQKARDRAIRPVIGSPPPWDERVEGSVARHATLSLNLKNEAQLKNYVFADVFTALDPLPMVIENFYSDPYHPNDDGYEIVAETFVVPMLQALTGPCAPSAEILCLNNGRFRVEVNWEDFNDLKGRGKAVPLTADTGFFWFFSASNIELVVKLLDGRGLNGHFWVFYGALSTVEYTITVTDTVTGQRNRYFNPKTTLASKGDTTAFPPPPSAKAESLKIMNLPDLNVLSLPAGPEDLATGLEATCLPSLTKLCLSQSRFEVKVRWKDFQGFQGDGQAVPLTADTGYFWFFSSNNVELAIKVLDGRLINGRFWVFYGALSNVEYSIEVKDTTTGNIVTYTNPSGAFASRADTGAFVP